MADHRLMDEREVLADIDPVCDGFHVNPHLVVTATASGEYEVSAPWTDFAGRGETERAPSIPSSRVGRSGCAPPRPSGPRWSHS